MNVFTEPDLKKAADSLNAAAPEGHRLAYIEPAEEQMLLDAGGAGVPLNESGVPAYPAWLLPALLGATAGSVISGMGSKAPTPPSGGETYESMAQAMLKNNPQLAQMMMNAFRGTGEYEGAGGVDMTRAQIEAQRELGPLQQQALLDQSLEFGGPLMEERRRLAEISQPGLFAAQQEYFDDPWAGGPTPTGIYGEGPELSEIADYEGMELGDLGLTPEGRAMLEADVFDQLALGERFTGEQERMLEQDLLRRLGGQGSAMLGGAPALREAQAKMEARGGLGRQRRGEALGLLASGQTVGDTARRDAAMKAEDAYRKFQTNMQKGQMQFGQRGQQLAGQMGALGTERSAAAGLAGMPQVQAQMPFMTPQMQQGYQPNMGQVFGPAANLAGGVYGQQMQEYMQPGIGSMLGQMGGAYLGTEAGAGAIGSAFGGLFGGGGGGGGAVPWPNTPGVRPEGWR